MEDVFKSVTETCALINPLMLNPFTLRAAKRGLMILEIFCLQKHFIEIF